MFDNNFFRVIRLCLCCVKVMCRVIECYRHFGEARLFLSDKAMLFLLIHPRTPGHPESVICPHEQVWLTAVNHTCSERGKPSWHEEVPCQSRMTVECCDPAPSHWHLAVRWSYLGQCNSLPGSHDDDDDDDVKPGACVHQNVPVPGHGKSWN